MNKIKLFSILITSLLLLTLTSCEKDEDATATVKVLLLKQGNPQSGATVCMFSSRKGPSTSFFMPFHADKKIITDANGIATFELQSTFDLDVIDNQTTLYFGTFKNELILGQTAVSIKEGETKSIQISY